MKIAIVGHGQLARMLALAGIPLGIKFSFLIDQPSAGGTQTDTPCVDGLGTIVSLDDYPEPAALYQALGCPDVVTVEKEQVVANVLEQLSEFCTVYPPALAVSICSDRFREKTLLDSLQIPTSAYQLLKNNREASAKSGQLTLPLVAKSTTLGYDGRNQYVLKNDDDLQAFANADLSGEWILEQWIGFDREVSIVAVRSTSGDIAHYPVTENVHRNGILISSVSPATDISSEMNERIKGYSNALLLALDYVGVLAIECFVSGDEIMVNELAPRVHNSGHWTQSGSATCQFENHIRAIAGLPLGSTQSHSAAGMVNLLGVPQPPSDHLTAHSSLHWYQKSPYPGRKVGHVNFWHGSRKELIKEMDSFAAAISADTP